MSESSDVMKPLLNRRGFVDAEPPGECRNPAPEEWMSRWSRSLAYLSQSYFENSIADVPSGPWSNRPHIATCFLVLWN